MSETTTTIAVVDGSGAAQNVAVEKSGAGVLTWHHVVEIAEAPISTSNRLPQRSMGDGLTLNVTIVTLTGGVDAVVILANPARHSLVITNTGLDRAWLGFGTSASLGSGLPLEPARIAGAAGGGITWDTRPPTGSLHAICTTGTTLLVLEGLLHTDYGISTIAASASVGGVGPQRLTLGAAAMPLAWTTIPGLAGRYTVASAVPAAATVAANAGVGFPLGTPFQHFATGGMTGPVIVNETGSRQRLMRSGVLNEVGGTPLSFSADFTLWEFH